MIPLPLSLHPLLTTTLSSISTGLTILDASYKQIHSVFALLWLI